MAENQVINVRIGGDSKPLEISIDRVLRKLKEIDAQAKRQRGFQNNIKNQIDAHNKLVKSTGRGTIIQARRHQQLNKVINNIAKEQMNNEKIFEKAKHQHYVNQNNLARNAFNQAKKEMRDRQRRLSKLGNAALGVGLSMLFLGMQIKALSQRTLQSIFKTFSEVTQGTMAYNQTIGRVSAAFEYLKFSIADAFMTSALGQALVETLVSIFDFLSSASDETKIFLVIVLLLGVAFGALAMVIGQLIIPLKVALDAGYGLKAIAKGIGLGFLIIAVILATIYGLVKIWSSDMSVIKKIGATLVLVFLAILAILFLFGVTLTAPVLILTFLIALVASLGLAFILAGNEFKLVFLKALRDIGNAIEVALLSPLLMIVGIINTIRKAAGMSQVDVAAKLNTSFLDSKIAGLQASIEQKKAEREAKRAEDNSTSNVTKNINIESFTAKAESVRGAVSEAMDLDQYNSLSGE